MSGHPAGSKEYWHEKYIDQNTPWDLNGPHPAMTMVLNEVLKTTKHRPLKIYVPGMGNGHDAAFFAKHGHQTIGGDISEKAVKNAKERYQDITNLDLKVLNAIQDKNPGNLDLIFDRAMFCALPASVEDQYLESCTQKLNKNGIFASIIFTKVDRENGPPWAISVDNFTLKMQKRGFKLFFQKNVPVTYKTSFIIQESIVIYTRA